MHGYVRYWVKAKIHGVWGLIDQSGKVEFGVERTLDLNNVPGAMVKLKLFVRLLFVCLYVCLFRYV